MIDSWIDIPNLQTVNLPDSFRYVESKSITSIDMNIIEWIGVSPILADLFPFTLDDIDPNSTSILFPNKANTSMRSFDFSQFALLKELIIGDDSFSNVNSFNIDGLNKLKSLKIGDNSFTNSYRSNYSRSFSILNCVELKSIEIGEYSFCDYSGGFKLNNLPKLSTIKMGSSTFRYSFSFEMIGIINVVL